MQALTYIIYANQSCSSYALEKSKHQASTAGYHSARIASTTRTRRMASTWLSSDSLAIQELGAMVVVDLPLVLHGFASLIFRSFVIIHAEGLF